jgi:hypothetical protein
VLSCNQSRFDLKAIIYNDQFILKKLIAHMSALGASGDECRELGYYSTGSKVPSYEQY